MEIIMKPIGIIYTPYKEPKDIPIQGRFRDDVEGVVVLKEEYKDGLRDLDGFSHAILLYYFHKSSKVNIEGSPYLEAEKHGIFAIRSPHRPNHIGFSIVRLTRIEDNKVYFKEVDMLDGTPLLDIKPYIRFFDERENVRCGWIEKHFESGEIPEKVILKGENR